MLPHSVLPLAPQAQAANPVVISSYTPFKDYDWLINYVAFYLFFTGTHNAIIQWISTPAGQAFFNEYPALNFLKAGIPSAN
ncbi:MAG: hypothetical protein Q3972_02145 [Corynebacterium sp.]|nr:hypothetical protein [Corynebacterium sp.]